MFDSGRFANRRLLYWVSCMLVVLGVFWLMPEFAFAQEEAEAAVEAAGEPEVKTQGFGAFLWWVIHMSGLIGLFLLILSIYFVTLVTRLFFELRPEIAVPPEVTQQCDELLQKRDFNGLLAFVKGDTSLFSRLLLTGINELPNGLSEARASMEGLGESAEVDMKKRISMLAVMGSVGPMIGLLGTLKGMIASFSVIAMSDTQIKASKVAEGISEALLLTFEGVLLAVPAIFFFSFFNGKVQQIAVDSVLKADHYLASLNNAARKKAPAPAPAGAPGAPPAPPKAPG